MEQPYRGRATIQDDFSSVQVVIPAKRNWFAMLFLVVWLGGWLLGEVSAMAMVFGGFKGGFAGFFILFWLIGWTVGGFVAFRTLLWFLIGKEIITARQGVLTIGKKGSIFFKSKTYDLNEVKNLRVLDESQAFGTFGASRNSFGSFNSGGLIRFDYGFKTVKFASGIDEAEALHIADRIWHFS